MESKYSFKLSIYLVISMGTCLFGVKRRSLANESKLIQERLYQILKNGIFFLGSSLIPQRRSTQLLNVVIKLRVLNDKPKCTFKRMCQ